MRSSAPLVPSRSLARGSVVLGAAAVALLLATPGASAATSCPDADATPASVGIERSAAAVACLVNHERQANGMATVAPSGQAAQAALWHADDMAARGYFSHSALFPAPHGTSVGDRLTGTGYAWTTVGENIARGQDTPRAVMKAWLASAGHCENIFRPTFTEAGYGISTAGNGPYWAQVFARPMGIPSPIGPAVSCPRAPAVPAPSGDPAPAVPVTPTAPAAGTPTTPAGTAATGTTTSGAAIVRPKAVASRSRRRLTVRVTMPTGTGRKAVVVRVLQRGRTVATRRLTRAAGRSFRVTATLPAARGGRVVVRTDGRSAAAAFR